MNALLDLGLTNAAVATFLALVAALACRFRIRPALQHGLWLLVLLKLIAPPLWSVRVGLPSPVRPVVQTVNVLEEVRDLEAWNDVQFAPANRIVELQQPLSEPSDWRGLAVPTPPRSDDARPGGSARVRVDSPSRPIPWRMVVASIWLAGSVVWLSLAAIRIGRFRRVLRGTKPADESIREHVDAVASRIGLGRVPQVVMTTGAVSPLVWGFGIIPKLLIPNGLWAKLDQGQRTTLLIHELAHLRRGDHLVRLLELVVTALYWWHPVVWLARRALRDAEEQCCDAWVVWAEPKAARSYATALLETVEFLSRSPGQPFAAPAAATGLGRVDHLKRRLTMILRGTTPRRLSLSGALAILGLAGVLLPLAPIAAQEEEKPEKEAHQYIQRLDVVPTLVGDVKIEEGKPVSNSVDVFAGTASQDEEADAKPKPEDDPTIAKEKADLDGQIEKLHELQKNNAELAKLAAELNGLREREGQVIQRMHELGGKEADVIKTTKLQFQNKDGSLIIIGNDGGRPGSQTIVRKLRVNPDGVPTLITEDIVGSDELQALKAQEAEARKELEAALRNARRPRSDPAVNHHRARLAEIQARLRALSAPRLNPDQLIDTPSEDVAPTEEARLRERLRSIELKSQGRYDYPNDPAYKQIKSQLDALQAKSNPRSNPDERIDALEKKLDSVLDELRRLKSGETEKDKPGPGF